MVVKKAGTILLNLQTKKIGLVYRDSEKDYTFPKGHLEAGETLKECAVRETEEETLRANHLLINKEICINTYTTPSGENVENYMYIAIDDGPTSKKIDLKDQENLKWISLNDVENILSYDNLKEFWNKIKSPIKDIFKNNGNISPAILTDLGICPTCYDKENNNCLYGDVTDRLLFENNEFECFLVDNPRADGHVIISTKKHYKDMMEIPDDLCSKIFIFAKNMMNVLKEVYYCESVYLCTMCDGLMNHFHIQLIPRYDFEKRGSKNFVKPRKEYVEDKEKINNLRNSIKSTNLNFINNLIIRKATYSDCKELSYLKREIWETTYRGIYPDAKLDSYDYLKNEEKFKNYIDNPNQQLYVVTDNNVIIAYIEFGKPFRPFENYEQEIGLFYIRKDYQGSGLGKKLFDFAYEYIKITSVDKFFISCHKYNFNAQKFYEKMGGKIVKVDDDMANNGLPQVKYEYKI